MMKGIGVPIETRDNESESTSGQGVEMVTSETYGTEKEKALLVSGRAASSTSSTGSSLHSGVSFDPKSRGSSGEGLADAPATSDSVSYGLE